MTEQENVGTTTLADGSVRIVIPLAPYTKKNSQQIVRGRDGRPFVVPSAQFKKYQAECGWYVKPLGIDRPVNLKAEFYMSTRRRVDLTNLNEALHDMLTHFGVIADDNATVVVSTDGSRVYYDKENPRTVVTITDEEPTFETAKGGRRGKEKI